MYQDNLFLTLSDKTDILYCIWINGHGYVQNAKPYYKRWYRGKRSKYFKQQSNRKIRRYNGELHKGNMAYKLYDFWWELC